MVLAGISMLGLGKQRVEFCMLKDMHATFKPRHADEKEDDVSLASSC